MYNNCSSDYTKHGTVHLKIVRVVNFMLRSFAIIIIVIVVIIIKARKIPQKSQVPTAIWKLSQGPTHSHGPLAPCWLQMWELPPPIVLTRASGLK